MTMTVKDANGNDIEVYTEAELKEQRDAAVQEHLVANPDRSDEVTKLQTELETAKKTLEEAEKGGGNSENLKKLREAAENKGKELETVKTELLGKIEEVARSGLNEYKGDLIEAYSRGDAELKKKIEFNIGQFKSVPKDKVAMKELVMNALKLSTDKPIESFMNGVGGAGDRGDITIAREGEVQETTNGKAMRSVFGISDADAKKYGGK